MRSLSTRERSGLAWTGLMFTGCSGVAEPDGEAGEASGVGRHPERKTDIKIVKAVTLEICFAVATSA